MGTQSIDLYLLQHQTHAAPNSFEWFRQFAGLSPWKSNPRIVHRDAVSAHCAEKCQYSAVGVTCETPGMDYDAAWKRLFGLPVLVEHLLTAFASPVAKRLDFSTLRQMPADSVDADGADRLLPVVVYSGDRMWNAPGGAAKAIVTADGEASLPLRGAYLLLDANRRAREDLPRDNLVAAVFELNASETLDEMCSRVRSLLDRLRGETRRAVFDWLRLVAPRMFPQADAEAVIASLEREIAEIEREEQTMMALAKRVQEWEAEWHRQGFERGLEAERELLCRMATRKFGAAAGDALARYLAGISDPDRLAGIGERIIDCGTGAEVLGWLDADRDGAGTR